MVCGVVIVDNRGYRWIAAFVAALTLLAVPAAIHLRETAHSGDGDRQAIEQMKGSLQQENDRRLAEVANIRQGDVLVVEKRSAAFGG